jgi:hypothetical protein
MADKPVAYQYSDQQRTEWVAEILAAADDKPGHHTYALALADYWGATTPSPDADRDEPTADDIEGITWKVECALSADFAAIHQPQRSKGMYGGDYAHEYVRMRGAARRAALLAAKERRLKKEEAERSAADSLADLLTFDSTEEQT